MEIPPLSPSKKKKYKAFFDFLKRRKSGQDDATLQKLHAEVFRQTNCLDCARCCKTHSPIILQSDIQRISKYIRMRPHVFMSQYLMLDADADWVFYSTPCPFLAQDNTCTIYEVRPKACREYPHTDRKKLYQITDITLKNAEICPAVSKILDLACGKGRHSIYLNQLGYDVTGADLSENSIKEASKFANEKLHFKVHDMRIPFEEKYDAIFNLFTSFGYFENDADNLTT
ncbi:MAG: YkgJ family cysteine cluster protein, partial [Chitinophagales bacterium]